MLNIIQIEDNQILLLLREALCNVELKYIEQPYRHYIQKPERVFVAELYHQLRNRQELFEELSLINVDLTKLPRNYGNDICFPDMPITKITPDIVIHNSQDNNERINQKLVCEVKTKSGYDKKIARDFKKLIFYKVVLNFQNAVFIYTENHTNLENIINRCDIELRKCIEKHHIIFATRESCQNNKCKWKMSKWINN